MPAPDLQFRKAKTADLPAIIAMLHDDPIGKRRETPGDPPAAAYVHAFEAVDADPNQYLAVAILEDRVVGTLQLTFIPGLARTGMWRGQIEAVRIAANHRGRGLGHAMFAWAIEECRARGCGLVQLTSDKSRTDAHSFYASLGFKPVHEGYKLEL